MICPAENCSTEMNSFDAKRVFGKSNINGETVNELLIPMAVTIYTCPKCNHAIIEDKKEQSNVVVPEEPKIILTT